MAENIPQPPVGLVESGLPVNFENVSRPAHGHFHDIRDAPRTVAHDDDPIRQRHRLDQVVGDEENGLPLLLPDL